jgi:integrase
VEGNFVFGREKIMAEAAEAAPAAALPLSPSRQILDSRSDSTKRAYARVKKVYEDYKRGAGVQADSEKTVLDFVAFLKSKFRASSLFTMVSLIKDYIHYEKHLDLGEMTTVSQFLKTMGKSEPVKQAAAFTAEQVRDFVLSGEKKGRELINRLVIGIGFFGGLRVDELVNLTFECFQEIAEGLKVLIPRSKTDQGGRGDMFLIPADEEMGDCVIDLFHVYCALVPEPHGRFFLSFRKSTGKFSSQAMGKNLVGEVPFIMASSLGVQDPDRFTGHSIRVTAASVLVDSGVSVENLKRFGRWKSTASMERYFRWSLLMKRELACSLAQGPSRCGVGEMKAAKSVGATAFGSPVIRGKSVCGSIFDGCRFENCTVHVGRPRETEDVCDSVTVSVPLPSTTTSGCAAPAGASGKENVMKEPEEEGGKRKGRKKRKRAE